MKIDFSQVLHTLNGEPFKKDKDTDATLGDMCITALLAEDPKAPAAAKDKLLRWELAKAVNIQGEIDLKVEDIALIKKMAGTAFAPSIMGAIYDLLEEEPTKG